MPSHTTLRAGGGLIPPDLLEKIAEGDAPIRRQTCLLTREVRGKW